MLDMSGEIDVAELSPWCAQHLGSEIEETLFSAGNLSRVHGLRLRDGRAVVVKVRLAEPRLSGCTEVQRRLWRAGFPCPQPLAGRCRWPRPGTRSTRKA